MELRRKVRIANRQGLHARPCSAVVSAALEFRSELRVALDGREVNGKSILELMTLNAAHGTELELAARGADAERLLERLERLFADGFGELGT
ncbi:MAG TPA: HPr family phosphocarrier protein [Planctomycetota bacterium]|nr:HPr family phosphocarrier protein [Planctomycetota bacterium]